MGAGASAAFPDGADELTKEQAQAIAGDKFSEDLCPFP